MNSANFLERLLDGAEVEWVALGEVIYSLKTGLNPRQNFQLNTEDANGYYVTVREIQNGKIVFLDKTDRVNTNALELINARSELEVGDILFSGTGTVGRIAVIEEQPWNWNIKEGVYVIKPNQKQILPRYLSHLLNSSEIVKKYSKKIVGSPVISLPMSDLKKLKLPIPCPNNPEKSLKIQAEIVRILDAFTELTTELATELATRKKQYTYYREQLLNFAEGEAEWVLLEKIAKIRHGKDWKGLNSGEIPVYGSGGIMGYVDAYSYNKPTVLIPRKGSITNIFYVDTPFWNVDTIYYTEIDTSIIIPKYLYYFIKIIDLVSLDTGSGRPSLTQVILNKIPIPIPYANDPEKSLAEQARIVAILDKFDALTNSISQGLPREIELRQKQYEYYRDKLLTFKELV